MVNIRSKVSKQGDKGKQRAAENPTMGSGDSPVQPSEENLVGRPTAPQFVTTEQLGEALRKVQEAVIRGVCEQINVSDQQPRVE